MGSASSVEATQAAIERDFSDFKDATAELLGKPDECPAAQLAELRDQRAELELGSHVALARRAPDFGGSKAKAEEAASLADREAELVAARLRGERRLRRAQPEAVTKVFEAIAAIADRFLALAHAPGGGAADGGAADGGAADGAAPDSGAGGGATGGSSATVEM